MHTIRLQVPAANPDARRSWRKLVTAVDTDKITGYAIDGIFVQAGAAYHIGDTGLLLGVDEATPTGHVVTLWRVKPDGDLEQVWQATRKGRWAGKATINAVAKRCTHTPLWQPRRLADGPNQTAGACRRCRRTVPAGDGVQWLDRYGDLHIGHRGRVCPPPPNRWPGMCLRCDGWMEPGEGIVAGRDPLTERILLAHVDCPPIPAPAPLIVNRWEGRCGRCHRLVAAGAGVYVRVHAISLRGPRGYVRHTSCPGRGRRRRPTPPPPGGGRRPAARHTPSRPGGRTERRTVVRRPAALVRGGR